ncbi:MAG: hypothetical protein NTW86_06300, partial [Candidatus Sumerlaeota bacterium]|nr:hypothetical protein [Candidatus Sumerlaeota bacterium]
GEFTSPSPWKPIEAGPLRAGMMNAMTLGASTLRWQVFAQADEPIVRMRLRINWNDSERIVKLLIPVTVITRRYKLGHWLETPNHTHDYRDFGDMLFDRETDPLEVNNLHGKPEMAAVEKELLGFIDEWTARVSDEGRRASAPNARKPQRGRASKNQPSEGQPAKIQPENASAGEQE